MGGNENNIVLYFGTYSLGVIEKSQNSEIERFVTVEEVIQQNCF